MKERKIGFVLSAPPKYSETFLLQEFELLYTLGYDIVLFEGYSKGNNKTRFKTIKSLPTTITSLGDLVYILSTLARLFLVRTSTCIKFISLEHKNRASIIRILKRIWFNAHILNEQVDFIHFCFADVAIQKELVAKSIKARMSVSLRGSDILVYPDKNKNCYNRLWTHVDKVHAVSNWVLNHAFNLGLNKHTPHEIIHDFVDTNNIQFNNSDVKWPLKFITVGRLISLKEQELAINFVHKMLQKQYDIKLIIVGDGPMRENLSASITKKHLSDNVQLCGKVSHTQVLSIMQTCDFYIHTSRSEGFNVSLLEAQASGLLTISLDAGSTRENIEDEKSGWIVQTRNVEALIDKIIGITSLSKNKINELKRYSRNRIEKNFDKKNRTTEWRNFFNHQIE